MVRERHPERFRIDWFYSLHNYNWGFNSNLLSDSLKKKYPLVLEPPKAKKKKKKKKKKKLQSLHPLALRHPRCLDQFWKSHRCFPIYGWNSHWCFDWETWTPGDQAPTLFTYDFGSIGGYRWKDLTKFLLVPILNSSCMYTPPVQCPEKDRQWPGGGH